MRTTLDIDAELLEEVMTTTGSPSKKKAIETALRELLRARRREEILNLIGNYEDFSLTLEELDKMRRES
ncbi:MAG: type II toxin-antitoxin system VapB family antitoxin [Acidobacteria bacterium]|nr:type II toxin-antitoxin system VapB family antitoxin [Acidobacteriota bacterium]